MIRAHICIHTTQDAQDFVRQINSDGTTDKYVIESGDGHYRADARSFLGVIYAMTEYNDSMYLVNESRDGVIPSFIDFKYRV